MNESHMTYKNKLLEKESYDYDLFIPYRYNFQKIIFMAIIFMISFTVLFIGHYNSNSMALLFDSMCYLSYLVNLGLTSILNVYSVKPANKTFSFGYARLEIIFSLISVFVILLICFNLTLRSIHIIFSDNKKINTIQPVQMIIFSLLGLSSDLFLTFLLKNHVSKNKNIN